MKEGMIYLFLLVILFLSLSVPSLLISFLLFLSLFPFYFRSFYFLFGKLGTEFRTDYSVTSKQRLNRTASQAPVDLNVQSSRLSRTLRPFAFKFLAIL
jgi:hypothetical protein